MIKVTTKTNRPGALKLANAIRTYLFEQEFDELRGKAECSNALKKAVQELDKIIKR